LQINIFNLKRIGILFLLIILLFQACGLLFRFNVKQTFVQFKMKYELKNNSERLEKLILTINEYSKNKVNSDEVFLDGKMYDIKSKKIVNGNVELMAIHDSEEEGIIQKIKQLVRNTGIPDSNLPSQLNQLISMVYLPTSNEQLKFIPDITKNIFLQFDSFIHSSFSTVFSPPPEVI